MLQEFDLGQSNSALIGARGTTRRVTGAVQNNPTHRIAKSKNILKCTVLIHFRGCNSANSTFGEVLEGHIRFLNLSIREYRQPMDYV